MKTSSTFKPRLAIGTAFGALLFAGTAHAWTVIASPAVGPPTSQVTVTGKQFPANSQVEVFLKWKHCSLNTDPLGQFSCTFEVPKVLEPGAQKIWTLHRPSGRWFQTPFTVRTDWPQFGFDAQRTAFNRYENVLSPRNVAGLGLRWSIEGSGWFRTPAVANGIMYLVRTTQYRSSRLYAYSAECTTTGSLRPAFAPAVNALANNYPSTLDCAPLWFAELYGSGETYTTPAVAHGRVYVGADNGLLYAFAAQGCGSPTCTPLWTAATGSYIYASPTVANGVVYVGSSNDDRLYAFSASGCGAATCSPLWSGSVDAQIFTSPSVANGIVYVGGYTGKVYAFAAGGCGKAVCRPLWTGDTGSQAILSGPTVADGLVYVGAFPGKLYAFRAACGQGRRACSPLWSGDMGGQYPTAPAVANGIVYIGNGGYGDVNSGPSKLFAFPTHCGARGATCSPLWVGTMGGYFATSPALANGVAYIGATNGRVYAFPAKCGFDEASCRALWTYSIGSGIESSPFDPVVANGTVYVGSNFGKLLAFGLKRH
jgi:outer membrane protein assembly factor BamB